MKKNILFLGTFLVLFTVSSCKKFLEEQSQTDIVPRSASALNELLVGAAYTNISDIIGDGKLLFLDDDLTSKIYFARRGPVYSTYTWQPESTADFLGAGSAQWSIIYPTILACNLVLDYAPKVTGTVAEKENVTGQAHLFRAYRYFQLVNYYGKPYSDELSNPAQDLGVPLMLKSALSLEGMPRNTVADVYKQILSDLTIGIEQLERNGKNISLFRMNHVAGYLLLSRVHLHLGNWQAAIEATTKVLNLKSDLNDLNAWGANKYLLATDNVEGIWAFGNLNALIFNHDSEGYFFGLSDDLLSSFENGDLRATVYLKKRIDLPNDIRAIAQLFRVPEALLNRAEAYAQQNKLGQTEKAQLALNDLNTLRKKRFRPANYQDLTISDADALLQMCYAEKRREYFLEENHRWFDLRRHGMPSITHAYVESPSQTLEYTLEDHDPGYVLQIPAQALEQNSKLIPNPEPAPRIGR